MCKAQLTGDILMALGAGLLVSMLIPRSFWTVLIGIILVALGCLVGKK